ncbi:MAG: RNA polymerase factor sigma-54 [Gemmobacter sp.]
MNQRPRTEIRQTQRLALSLGLAASIHVLRQDASGLTLYLEEQAAANPWLRLEPTPPPPGEWLPRWGPALAALRGGGGPIEAADTGGPGPSLIAHVAAQIDRLVPLALRPAALVLAEALEPSGWLGRPLSALAAEARLTPAQAEGLLRTLQRIEPAGLFARNLSECLALQCREAGLLDAVMVVVLGRLDLLAAGDTARLARLAGVDEGQIVLRQRQIRGLNPKPGALFDPGAAPVREPDLIVREGADGWKVALNRSALPDVAVAPRGTARLGPEDRNRRQAARDICRQVEARSSTLLRVAAEILRRQTPLIDRGPVALVPMTMADVAGATDLHVSTVSRAVAGAAMDTPAGTFWLRHLFTAALKGDTAPEQGLAGGAVRARLARLVAGEDKTAPFSDAALALALAENGIAPARRTVAKYRAALSIPPAHSRRQRRHPT